MKLQTTNKHRSNAFKLNFPATIGDEIRNNQMTDVQFIAHGTAKAGVNQQIRPDSERTRAHLLHCTAGSLRPDSGYNEPDGVFPDPANTVRIPQHRRNLGPHGHDKAYVRHIHSSWQLDGCLGQLSGVRLNFWATS